MNDETPTDTEAEPIQLSEADQKKIARFIEKQQRGWLPLTPSHGGYVASDSEGHMYAKQNGGLVRITITPEGEPMRLAKKWGKRQRREARRAAKNAGRSEA